MNITHKQALYTKPKSEENTGEIFTKAAQKDIRNKRIYTQKYNLTISYKNTA